MDLSQRLLGNFKTETRKTESLDPSSYDTKGIVKDPTLSIIVFPNIDDDQVRDTLNKEITLEDFLEHLEDILNCPLRTNKKFDSKLLREQLRGVDFTMTTTLSRDPKEKIDMYTCHKLVRQIVIKRLGLIGFDVILYYSRDGDEIFCKILPADEEIFMIEAENRQYVCQLREDLEPDANKYAAAYHQFLSKHKDKFQKYDADDNPIPNGPEGSYFRHIDKMRISINRLSPFLDIGCLLKKGYLVNSYNLHDYKYLDELKDTWANFKEFYSFPQPLEKIRSYFGETICLYFAWMEYYVKWLVFASCFGIFCKLAGTFHAYSADTNITSVVTLHWNQTWNIIFGGFVIIWASVFCELWDQKNAEYKTEWGTSNFVETQPPRPEFEGERIMDPLTGKHDKYYPEWKRTAKKIVSYSIAVVMVMGVISTVSAIFIYKSEHKGVDNINTYCSLLNTVQIKIFNFVYSTLAVWSNNWENHRTQSDFDDALAFKLFLFQFVNCYNSFFYIAFVKKTLECPPPVKGDDDTDSSQTTDSNCDITTELQTQLLTIMVINLMLNLVELGMPYAMFKLKQYKEAKKVDSQIEEGFDSRKETCYTENQSKLGTYGGTLDDYLEVVIQYGYVLLFGVSEPLVIVMALVNIVMEIRVDAFKLCYLLRRPNPSVSESLGIWDDILRVLSGLGVITNVGIIIFTTNFLEIDTSAIVTNETVATVIVVSIRMFFFVAIEHIMFVAKALISTYVPDRSERVETIFRKAQRIVRTYMYSETVTIAADDEESIQEQTTQKKLREIYKSDPHEPINKERFEGLTTI